MLEILKKVSSAVATKDLVPVMTHFCIGDGRIQAVDGRIAIDAPLPELAAYAFTVPAEKLIKAIDACTVEPTIKVTDTHMHINAGKLKVRLPILPADAFPRAKQVPSTIAITTQDLLPALRMAQPFIATDASRGFATGALLHPDGYVFGTNNVAMVRVECEAVKCLTEPCNLPLFAVEELIKIGDAPVSLGLRDNSLTLYYADGSWFNAQLNMLGWPLGTIASMFANWPQDLPTLPADAASAMATVANFSTDMHVSIICLGGGLISTPAGDQSAEVEGFDFTECRYDFTYLEPVFAIAETFGGASPARFSGPGFRGLITGMRT